MTPEEQQALAEFEAAQAVEFLADHLRRKHAIDQGDQDIPTWNQLDPADHEEWLQQAQQLMPQPEPDEQGQP